MQYTYFVENATGLWGGFDNIEAARVLARTFAGENTILSYDPSWDYYEEVETVKGV